MEAMNPDRDAALAAMVTSQLAAAKERLLEEMLQHGLTPAKGWRIAEELRHTLQGTEFIYRPVHMRQNAPELAVTVVVDHEGRPL